VNPQIRHAQRACEAAKATQAVVVWFDEHGQHAIAYYPSASKIPLIIELIRRHAKDKRGDASRRHEHPREPRAARSAS
jgi:hypothetical protein